MNYDDGPDVQTLYPVQRKAASGFHVLTLDEKDEEELKNDRKDSLPNGGAQKEKVFHKAATEGKIRVDFSLPPGSRKASTAARRLSDDPKTAVRRNSLFPLPPTSVRGPGGRRQSAWVDYSFYNRRISSIPELANRENEGEKSKVEAALHECSSAMRHIRLNGVRQFVNAATLITKLFWLLLFAACVSVLIYGIMRAFDNYYSSPVTTTFTIHTPRAIKFPDVYICFGNSLNRSYIRQHPEAVKGMENLYATVVGGDKRRRKRQASFGFDDFAMPWDRKLEHVMESWLRAGLDSQPEEDSDFEQGRRRRSAKSERSEDWNNDGEVSYNFLLKAGFKVNETFLNCSFRSYKSQRYECSEIVKTVMDPNYFTCYVVSVPIEQVVANKGLRLLINSQVGLYPLVAANDTQPNKYAGLFVSISDRFDPTNWHKGVVRPGTLTKLTLSATKVKLLDVNQSSLKQPCMKDADGVRNYHIFNTSYSRTACQMDCLVYAFYRHCNCVFKMDKSLVKSNIMESAPFCAFSHTKSCLIPLVTNSPIVLDRVNKCREHCHTPCSSIRYQIRGSASVLNPAAFSKKLPVKDLVLLEISFGHLEMFELTQSYSKTVAQTIADVGGQVNLWLGASMITLIEIPIIFVAYCCYRLYQKMVDALWKFN